MKMLIAVAVTALAAGPLPDATPILHPLESIDHRSIACGCTFTPALDSARDSYAEHDIIVLDLNGEPPNARVNLGKGNIHLQSDQPIAFPLYQCAAGATWSSRWRSAEVKIAVDLVALHPGEEACWFEGSLVASVGKRSEVSLIKGACGC
jgi:hypothetical protein